MDVLVLIGRILFVLLFFASGINHLTQTKGLAAYAESKGVPATTLAVRGSGVLLIVAALSILLGIWPDIGALLLVVFLIPTAFLMHNYWTETDSSTRQTELLSFQKDIALAGAALMLFGLSVTAGDDFGLVVTGPLF